MNKWYKKREDFVLNNAIPQFRAITYRKKMLPARNVIRVG